MNIRSFITTISAVASFLAAAAQTDVKGVVVNSSTGEPFAGARVAVVGSRTTSMTGDDGVFTLPIADDADALLRIEAPGFDAQLLPLRGLREVHVCLLPSGTAEATYDDYALSASSAAVTTKKRPATVATDENVAMLLAGDLWAQSHSGIDAGGHAFFVRGLHSLNMQSQPLFVVDGQIWQSQLPSLGGGGEGISLHEGYFTNPLALLSPDDIERIEVLKNGTAVWGAKAGGGVILITTKRSHNMATEIEVNLSAGIRQQGRSLPMLGAADYRILASDLFPSLGEGLGVGFLNDDANTTFYRSNHNDTDWQSVVGRTSASQNYGIAVRGGDDVALYAFSLGYARGEGMLRGTDFDRLNLRFNSDIELTKRLKTRADIAFAQVTRNIFDDGIFSETSPRYMGYVKSPLYNARQFDTQGRLFDRLSDVDELGVGNPMAIIENAEGKTKNYRFTALLAPTYLFSDRLSLSALVAHSWDKSKESAFIPDFGLPETELLNAQGDWYGTARNSVSSLMTRHSTLTLDLHADWNILNHQFSILNLTAGLRYLNDTFEGDYGQGYNTGSDNLRSLSVTTSSLRTTDGTNDDRRSMSWYAQAGYSLKNRYLLNASLALETNSRFGREADGSLRIGGVAWALFPSVDAAWIVTGERFMRHASGINYLKLHVGYDLTGNDDLPAGATRTYFGSIGYAGLAKGLAMENVGNDKLKWERSGTLTAGIDMRLLSNRLTVRADYFRSVTDDLLMHKQLPADYGLQSYWTNDGRLQNEGFEVSLSGRLIDRRHWQMNAHLSVGHYKNEVKRLTDGDFTTDVLGARVLTSVGRPLGVFYGYRTLGVFTDQQEADRANLGTIDATGRRQAFAAGDIHFADLRADGIIDEQDMDVIGDPNPDIYGSFGFDLTWKGLTFDALFTYSLGNDAYNALRQRLESGSSLSNQTESLLRRWTADGQVTDMPRAVYGDPMGNSRFSDRWIEDASYMKLRQLSLSYDLPIRPRLIQGLQLWASVENLFTLTRYLGADPEFSYATSTLTQGIDAGLMPQSRSYHFGVKLNL